MRFICPLAFFLRVLEQGKQPPADFLRLGKVVGRVLARELRDALEPLDIILYAPDLAGAFAFGLLQAAKVAAELDARVRRLCGGALEISRGS